VSAARGGAGGAGGGADRIVAVDVVRCALPIARAVHIGATVYREREYVALRLTTADGTEGHAIGYTRGLPLDATVLTVADLALGCRVSRRAAVVARILAERHNGAATLWRAVSLIEIALWDAQARLAGLPLWRLLGGARERVPVMAVAGYHATERGVDDVVDEVRRLVDEGFGHVKLHAADPSIVAAVRAAAPGIRLGVDVGMAWRSLAEAVSASRPLDELGLAFIEDPFPPERWRLTAELAGRLRTPLAAGEDAAGRALLLDLASVVAVLRVDATVSGGFAVALEAAAVADARGATVMTHAFPDLHAHLAGAAAVGMIEMIPDAAGVNPVGLLLGRRQDVAGGELVLSKEPGHGAPLDWEAVARAARASTRLEHESEEDGRCD
jgi:L-alanine-DL-glutamate epimerase-like enolase superfamily enzyme